MPLHHRSLGFDHHHLRSKFGKASVKFLFGQFGRDTVKKKHLVPGRL
jgi:hypothetical protein